MTKYPPSAPLSSAGTGLPFVRSLTIAYVLLLIYGSLFPLSGWDWRQGGLPVFFASHPTSRSDIFTNLVIYVPLGLLLSWGWRKRIASGYLNVLLVVLCGTLLSFSLEYLQSYLPSRTSSVLDTALNGTGTLLGALLARGLSVHSVLGAPLQRLRSHLFLPGSLADLGLAVVGLWTLSQLAPFIPSLDRGTLVQGIHPLLDVLRNFTEFNAAQSLSYALNIASLGLLATTLIRPERRPLLLYSAFTAAVLLLKIPIVGRQLSLEALNGGAIGLCALPLLVLPAKNIRPLLAGALLLLAYTLQQLHGGGNPHGALRTLDWIPFADQMASSWGLEDIVANLWPFAALAYLVLIHPSMRRPAINAVGTLLVFVFAFILEWMQTRIPGRYPNITDACLAAAGWWLAWMMPLRTAGGPDSRDRPSAQTKRGNIALIGLAVVTLALVMGWSRISSVTGPSAEQSTAPPLPAPEALAAVSLPGFHHAHPRLPSPDAAEIARLRKENPAYLSRALLRAQQGNPDAAVIAAYLQPGSQDLEKLRQQLLALTFRDRGDMQTKPLAVAYDWLYDQWSETQRLELRNKLAKGCQYEIDYIRRARLSPYNVFLYNSPMQALMACSIALYGDDPRGDAMMAFTDDLWKKRILPVWRQVMGRNGGWHEGGEYVGIGIGQAIYELPAMWRKATGEDIFAVTPGIRGFLDFLIYRTRPDGTDFRWGDASYFLRVVPDLLPLAMEYRDKAAYSLRPTPPLPVPSSWPWGPLTDNSLYDPEAITHLPLTAHFDGLGLIVARSNWTADATYVTFKAGDNYWSHSHLDQGAFTIYKGGALAIDSGFYGPYYDSDHHMDYDYQTIAHNTITVTDPADTVPAPARRYRPPRPIANDGGQRRVGSGWGVEAAPLDLDDWQRKREIYHTGKIEQLLVKDGLTVAVADLTPAYTNAFSGQGTFADRTRRVEDFHRVFAYDRIDDVVVIFDRVAATKAEFRKRWLLHTLEKPVTTPDGFLVQTAPTGESGHAGGRLEGHVLLPRDASIQLVGGEGHQYFVDGKNYDEGVAEKLQRHKGVEPGAWRIEVSPPNPRDQDEFLVVLLPSLLHDTPHHSVRLLNNAPAGSVGVEIRGPHRTSRWYFDELTSKVRVELTDKDGSRFYELHGDPARSARHTRTVWDSLVSLFK